MKTLIGLRGLGRAEIESLVDLSLEIHAIGQPRKSMLGRTICLAFFEPSTRTRLSFDLAAQRVGGDVVTYNPATSSTTKGESLRDTIATLRAIGSDVLVVRHSRRGMAEAMHDWTGMPVINAGDGDNEHPTQALLDLAMLKGRFGDLLNLRLAIVGDVIHSRVARSLVYGAQPLGVDITLVGPDEFLPKEGWGVRSSGDLDSVLPDIDVVYLLRVQQERGASVSADYHTQFGLTPDRSMMMGSEAVIMHPGPINRGIEIDSSVADGPRSLILEQVSFGVPTRMAVFETLARELA